MATKPKLLFFVTEDWAFCLHRLPLAKAAVEAGFDVAVAVRERNHGDIIRAAGIRLIPFEIARRGMNPYAEIRVIKRLVALYLRERPDIVHHVTIKPVLYGAIAARIAGVPRVVNALTGLGWTFISRNILVSLLRILVQQLLRFLLVQGRVIVQNPDDMQLLVGLGVPQVVIRLIRGSGVDVSMYTPHLPHTGIPVVALVARMLWDKGVGEFVQAARVLKSRGVSARFVLVGDPDMENPAGIQETTLRAWVEEDIVEWWGYQDDMPAVYSRTDIACLPSYREGLPKSLLEAAAAGLPIVTTDVPGCREAVIDGDNGLLVPVRDADALAEALVKLLVNGDMRSRMGKRGRERAESEFSVERVVAETIQVYRELLA
jgi:glycosyltransferase involved in cell wall biosynthesis